MTTADTNGRATIREVHALLGEVRGDVQRGFDRLEERLDNQSRHIERTNERVNFHVGLRGHPEVVEQLSHVRLAMAKWAGLAGGAAITVQFAIALGLKVWG